MTHVPEVTRVGKSRAEARMVIDADGQIREANEAAHRLLNYGADSLINLSLAWIMPPSRHALLGELKQALHEGAGRSLPCVLMRNNSSLISVLITTHPCTGSRGQELALSFELDEQPVSRIQPVDLGVAKAAAKAPVTSRPPAQRDEVPEQLAACMELLHWLDGQLQCSGERESPRERALARIVLQEASQLIEHCQNALRIETRAK